MSLTEKVGNWIDGEKRMVEREHKKIRRLVEKTDAKGYSMCYYSHDSSDGWTWDEKDYLDLRLWLNSLGLFSLKDKKGIYILWSFDEKMRSLIRQQREVLTQLKEKERQSDGIR